MMASSVTLEEVLTAAQTRRASLVPETSGYLALAIGDATSRLPFLVQERAVTLTTEGSVVVERGRDVVAPPESARALRDILARLLEASVGSMPGLSSAARPRPESEQGVDTVVEELEAALIPVNRAAARRALARLARETLRAKTQGKLRRKKGRAAPVRVEVSEAPAPAPKRPATAPPPLRSTDELPLAPEPEAGQAMVFELASPPPPLVSNDAIDVVLLTQLPMARPAAPAESSVEASPEAELGCEDPVELLPEVEPTPTRFETTTFDFDPPAAEATILDVETAAAHAAPREPRQSPEVEAVVALEAALLTHALEDEPRLVAPPSPQIRARGEARLRPTRTSDVDDLLSRFATSDLRSGDVRQVRAELKMMIGLEPTDAPPEVESAFCRSDDAMTPTRFYSPKPVQLEARRPSRAGRVGLVLSTILIVLGLALTAFIWKVFPAFFAGKSSAVADER